MTLQSTLRTIEAHDFAARLAVANTTEMLFDIAQQEQAVKDLLSLLKDSEQAKIFLSQIVSLLREQEDVRYRNSRDIAIAVSIWALNRTQPALAKLLAAQVLGAPRLWWARRAAMEHGVGPLIEPVMANTKDIVLGAKVASWGTTDTQAKDVLIVSEPPVSMLEEHPIVSPNAVFAKSDAAYEEKELSGGYTTNNMQTNEASATVEQ